MKIPVSWLNDFVKVDDLEIKVLEEKLVSIGFEIEEVINLRNNIQNVVIGQVVSIEKMENTNHLNICSINIGSDILTIITGAQNVKKGDKVPVAKIGAILPGDKHISLSKLAGKDSYGMLCSGTELNLTEDDFIGAGVNGIWILPPDSIIGQDINDFLGINDYVLDIAITANRPDCNSVLGIAREVAACLNRPLIEPDLSYEVSNIKNINSILQVNNNNYKLCPRYMAAGVIDCKQVISPKIIRDRLKAVNIRPINNLVDITNYVLIEIGQPMHAFDYSNLEKQTIIIRNATKDEEITCLDGNIYKLSDENLVICDGIKPVAIAGIMGGEYSSILESTKDVILESAKFERSQIRHTARNINLHSDSSARFEKGIDYLSQEIGLKRALHLFYKYKWGTIINGIIDKKDIELNMKTISFTNKDITKILGIEISNESIINILNNLQIKTIESNNSLLSTIPLFREDIISINDLAEEIIRFYGYNHINPILRSNMRGYKTDYQINCDRLRNYLIGNNLFEIITYSFIPNNALEFLNLNNNPDYNKEIKLLNPIGGDMSIMRTQLSYSLLKTIENNYKKGNKELRLFEIANIYINENNNLNELPKEETHLSIGLVGEKYDYYSIKSILDELSNLFDIEFIYKRSNLGLLHPGKAANIFANNINIGYIGEVHPDIQNKIDIDKKIYIAEINSEYLCKTAKINKLFKSFSKFQDSTRDLALIMDKDIEAQFVLSIIKNNASSILQDIKVFDVYEGEQILCGKKSMAINLTFRDSSKTLTDNEINIEIDKYLNSLKEFNISLR